MFITNCVCGISPIFYLVTVCVCVHMFIYLACIFMPTCKLLSSTQFLIIHCRSPLIIERIQEVAFTVFNILHWNLFKLFLTQASDNEIFVYKICFQNGKHLKKLKTYLIMPLLNVKLCTGRKSSVILFWNWNFQYIQWDFQNPHNLKISVEV